MPATHSRAPAEAGSHTATDWHQRFARYYADVLRSFARTSSRSLTALDGLLAKQVACDLGALGAAFEDCMDRDTIVLDVRTDRLQDVVESDELEPGGSGGTALEDEPGSQTPRPIDRRAEARAARKIHRTQSQDPYNRETTIGGPLLKLQSGGTRVVGPLLYWEVDIDYDPGLKRVTLTKRTDVPELNTMLLEPFLAEGQDMGEVVMKIRPLLLEEALPMSCLPRVFSVITGLFEELEHLSLVEAADLPVPDWIRGTGHVAARAVLVNTPKSNAVLLEDLRQLAELSGDSASGPLSLLTRREDAERDPLPPELPLSFSDSTGAADPLFFPFLSNPAQRRIAQMAERATILTVQGPPGTGKSHTISNLVCHLVATGRSVLVTSHQAKAVEVVTELLKPMRGLALSLANGDRQSSRDLQNRIQALLEDNTLRSDAAAEDVKRGGEALARLDRELRLLAHRFQELRRKEHEGWNGFRSFAELREWNHIDPDDTPQSANADLIVEHLPRWYGLRCDMAPRHGQLASLLSPQGTLTAGTVEARIHGNLQRLVRDARSIQQSPVGREVQAVKELCESAADGPAGARALVGSLLEWMEGDGWSLVEQTEQALPGEAGFALPAWDRAARSAAEEALAGMDAKIRDLLERFEDRGRLGDGSLRIAAAPDAERLRAVMRVLRNTHGSLLRWHLVSAPRRARRVIAAFLGDTPERTAFDDWSGRVERAVARYEAELEAADLAAEVGTYLPAGVSNPPLEPGAGRPAEWLRSLRVLGAQCAAMRLVRSAPVDYWSALMRIVAPGDTNRFSRESLAAVLRVLRSVAAVLDREELFRTISDDTPLSPDWRSSLTPLLADLKAGRISDTSGVLLDHLDELLGDAEAYRRLRDLERGELSSIPRTLRRLETELQPDSPTPVWIVEHVRDALEAHRLHQMIRGSLGADPDDVASVAENLRLGQERRRELIAKLVEHRLRLRQAGVLEEGSAAAELRRVRRLLGMQKRLRASLVSLRDQIDYRAVLGACPAWLGTIDDVCRLFPAQPELFDYVIIDEASQCAQPALLPLALRARHLIVVGDAKQLRPSFGRFLRQSDLDALRAKHGLAEHRAGVFAEGGDSLLDFAEYRANQSGFLDEHFRCDPAIIAWSNERYYNNRLKVLTHRRPNAFQPPLIVRELADADDDPDRKYNVEEANAIVRELRRLTDDPSNEKLTMGVISPFRVQADVVQSRIEEEFERDAEVIRRHRILASTADGFQGDERDIILYSFRLGPSSNANSLGVLEREEERFNVAFSRARLLALSFISTAPARFPSKDGKSGVVRSWLDHVHAVQRRRSAGEGPRPDVFDSEFERSVCERLRERGLNVVTQEPCGPFRIDLVVKDDEGRVLAVECDGSWKEDEYGQLRPEDYQRQDLIERAGWVVHRISGRRYLLDPIREIDRTLEVLRRQETEGEKAVLRGESAVPAPPAASTAAPPEQGLRGAGPDEPVLAPARIADDAGEPASRGVARKEPALQQAVLGRPIDEIRPLLRQLIRWTLLGSRVQGSMFDRLIAIDERLAERAELDDADIAALEFVHRIALQHGFEPEGHEPQGSGLI